MIAAILDALATALAIIATLIFAIGGLVSLASGALGRLAA
jgi:hypothetical protein